MRALPLFALIHQRHEIGVLGGSRAGNEHCGSAASGLCTVGSSALGGSYSTLLEGEGLPVVWACYRQARTVPTSGALNLLGGKQACILLLPDRR